MTKHDRMLAILANDADDASGAALHDALDRTDVGVAVDNYSVDGAAKMANDAREWWKGGDRPQWLDNVEDVKSPAETKKAHSNSKTTTEVHKTTGDSGKDAKPTTKSAGGR